MLIGFGLGCLFTLLVTVQLMEIAQLRKRVATLEDELQTDAEVLDVMTTEIERLRGKPQRTWHEQWETMQNRLN